MEYPKRPKFFAHRFCRLMAKVCLANEIGPEACWMLSVIAHTEDASHYRRAVTFFNEQLFPIVGIGSVSALKRLREKLVDAGWLHYEPGAKGRAARYWVTIPKDADGIDDYPTDEQPDEYSGSEMDQNTDYSGPKMNQKADRIRTECEPESGRNVNQKADRKRTTIIPIPVFIPGGEAHSPTIQDIEQEFLSMYVGPKLKPSEVYLLVEEALQNGITENELFDEINRANRSKREVPRIMISRLIDAKKNHIETPQQEAARIQAERAEAKERRRILKLERSSTQ